MLPVNGCVSVGWAELAGLLLAPQLNDLPGSARASLHLRHLLHPAPGLEPPNQLRLRQVA